MACVCLKNAIDKFWRNTAPNSIKEEERLLLKALTTRRPIRSILFADTDEAAEGDRVESGANMWLYIQRVLADESGGARAVARVA